MNCCLCQKRLATDKRKRRKLHGPSCSTLKEELQKLSSVSLESLETLSDRDAYLCSTCEFQLKSIINLNEKLSEHNNEVRSMLSKLQSVYGTPMEAQRKRHLPDSSSSEPASKQLCMAASQVSILDEDSARLTLQSQSSSSCQPGDHASPDVQVISTGPDNLMP